MSVWVVMGGIRVNGDVIQSELCDICKTEEHANIIAKDLNNTNYCRYDEYWVEQWSVRE